MNLYARQQTALSELCQNALAGADPSALMDRAVVLVARTLEADLSRILELLPDQKALLLRAGVGWQEGIVGHTTVMVPASLAGHTWSSNAPVAIADWRSETRFGWSPFLRDHAVRSSLCVVIHSAGRFLGVLSVDSRQHRTFTDAEGHFLQAVADVLALAIERVRARETLEQWVEERTRELERRHRVAQSLHDILTIINSSHRLDDILDYIITEACDLLDTAAGAIYRCKLEDDVLAIRAACGLDVEEAALSLPLESGAIGKAVLERVPVTVPDTAVTCSGGLSQDSGSWLCPAQLAHSYRALLAVPLIVEADIYGAIALFYREPRRFSDEEVRLAATLSDQAALAIENARLVAAAEGRGILEERQRLARDLHDSVTQALYGIALHAEASTRLLASGDITTAAQYLHELQQTTQEALEEMRLLIFELRPPVLDQEGLVAALRARLDAVEGRANLHTEFAVRGVDRLPPAVEQALYRIAQEALNNALKHAHARSIAVSLSQQQNAVVLEIADDGAGFDPTEAIKTGGFGLRGIKERVAQLGGWLNLDSSQGTGTRVRIKVML